MTDNEIIKALEEWSERGMTFCNVGMTEFARNILGLINRQKAEIERLKTHKEHSKLLIQRLKKKILVFQSEARKEFAEKVKEIDGNLFLKADYDGADEFMWFDNESYETYIDNLLNEMEKET